MKFFVVLILLLATEPSPPRIPCLVIAPFVTAYGKEAVVGWARAHGYSDIQIVEVTKRCEKKGKK